MKKNILIELLKKLLPYRDMAEGFLYMINENSGTDEQLDDELYDFIVGNIKKIKSEKTRNILSENIKKIKEREENFEAKEKNDADRLLDDLLDI